MGVPNNRLPSGLKELVPHGYVGIDFGTSNSHFAYCNTDGALAAEPICLDGNEKSVHTCVLWKEPGLDDSDVVTFGSEAVQEWSNREPAERKGFRFAAGFKPDIVVSDRARLDARGFLRKAYLTIREKGVLRAIGRDEGMPVVVGVPAEIGPEHRRITAQLAEEAGFGPVTCIEEPLGALAYHLANNDVSAAEAHRGVVVVNFGGGTLDVALMDQHGLRDPWGDPTLGGRLFDDLFFQWLLDQNPGKEIDPGDVMFVWQLICRQMKEEFSQRWAKMGPTQDFRKRLLIGDSHWQFRDASVERIPQACPGLSAQPGRPRLLPQPGQRPVPARRGRPGQPVRLDPPDPGPHQERPGAGLVLARPPDRREQRVALHERPGGRGLPSGPQADHPLGQPGADHRLRTGDLQRPEPSLRDRLRGTPGRSRRPSQGLRCRRRQGDRRFRPRRRARRGQPADGRCPEDLPEMAARGGIARRGRDARRTRSARPSTCGRSWSVIRRHSSIPC